MGLFNFLTGNDEEFNTLVKYYEEYVKSCTLQPTIFPQMAYPLGGMDVFNSDYVLEKTSYIAQFNRLIDAIRFGDVKDKSGREIDINLMQEIYLRFTLASWIMSKLNSCNNLGSRIRTEMNKGYNQLLFSVNLQYFSENHWMVKCDVQLFKEDFDITNDVIEINLNEIIFINKSVFDQQNPFKECTLFEDTPQKLLETFFILIRWLFFETPPLVKINKNRPTIGRVYADFWLKKMVVAIIMSSEEWDKYIFNLENIEEIRHISYYLCDDKYYTKQIQFKFSLKTRRFNDYIYFDYKYSIPSARAFNLKYINRLANFVSTNHNLSY